MAPPHERTYDGADMTRAEGTMTTGTNEKDNTGRVDVALTTPEGDRYEIVWTDFRAKEDWKRGGIAADIMEHGGAVTRWGPFSAWRSS